MKLFEAIRKSIPCLASKIPRQYRVSPLGANNLTDAGELLVIRPHEMQARTSQAVILSPEGEPREVYTLIVEKLTKIETTPDGTSCT